MHFFAPQRQVGMDFSIALHTEWTGWLVAVILGVQIALPFLLRRVPKTAASPGVSPGTIPQAKQAPAKQVPGNSMRWHYLLGFVLPAVALAHGWIPMASGHMPRTNIAGLWLATFALALMFLQLLIGLATQQVSGRGNVVAQTVLRRVHFVAMLAIAALALSHMLLNFN